MADIIRLLPDHVVNQIAAGEVVQRPASVVKELLENAIDAKAKEIKLLIKDAGRTLIQLMDDGMGMSMTDARMCFERHATSKIRKAEDLFSLHTMGFRGEALASIAAISHVELITRPASEEVATKILAEGSTVKSQGLVASPLGTSIAVKNLFYNLPARRNFLKSDQVELRHIIDEFQRVALAHPEVAMSFYNNGSELFLLPQTNLRKRIAHIFGNKADEVLVPLQEETDIVKISGFIGKPQHAKRKRGEQLFYVNERFVRSPYLHHAVINAYEGLLKDKTHPSYFIFLECKPAQIDINIHPTKTEVKFEDEQALYSILRATVKHSLGQFQLSPILDFERDPSMDVPYSYKNKTPVLPKIHVNSDFNPFKESPANSIKFGKPSSRSSWEALYEEAKQELELKSENSDQESHHLFSKIEEISAPPCFQILGKYILSAIKSGMVVVEQTRAHERILYERFMSVLRSDHSVSQQLLFPLQLSLAPAEILILEPFWENLQDAGFIVQREADHILLSAIPMHLTSEQIQDVFQTLISDLQEEIPDSKPKVLSTMAIAMAKAASIKSGQLLDKEEQEALLNDLFLCDQPSQSLDGRPTFVTISADELDKKFLSL